MFGVDSSLLDVEISGCKAGNRGGGIFVKDQNFNLADMRFRNNSAASGGAVALKNIMTAQIKRSSFMGHTASANGGVLPAIGAGSSSVKMSDIFVENSAGVNGGGFEI